MDLKELPTRKGHSLSETKEYTGSKRSRETSVDQNYVNSMLWVHTMHDPQSKSFFRILIRIHTGGLDCLLILLLQLYSPQASE